MNNSKLRIKLLEKIAQATTPTTVPTDQTANTAVVAAAPSFQASSMYPGILKGFNLPSINIINNIVSTLNTALHIATAGKINFQILKNNNFSTDPSSFQSSDQKNIFLLSKMVFQKLLNSGNQFENKLIPKQIQDIVGSIISSQPLLSLSSINPVSQLAQKVGNLKQIIIDQLTLLKNNNI